ncbi:MAG TPA: single-stranded DNA-binding protein [Synergistaceae bacterium]|nr:MAG: Single-stranded DNA-binding protein [Synergistales bacterium 53_16]MDK2845717.1 single-strand DNA-binding protein [Synergistales bacterium]MDN5335365.1 single-strand DNA-binding protein [Synergistales bacterium]HAA47774.1 single-stranded DNA-binding protein [Synergistaceae bacterium]HAG22448.1 single-stranded DNA-binding protein [Synergistaceae bacterium]
MARGFNKVILMGNLARDPEVRYTTSNQAIAKITVAVNRISKNRDGEVQEQVDFIPVVVFGNQAENCERYLRKGSAVLVEGRMQVRNYETSSGERRWVTEVVAQQVNFVGSRRDNDGGYRGQEADSGTTRKERVGSLREKGFDDDFPMDFSEVDSEKGEDDEVDIPF